MSACYTNLDLLARQAVADNCAAGRLAAQRAPATDDPSTALHRLVLALVRAGHLGPVGNAFAVAYANELSAAETAAVLAHKTD